MGLPDKLLTPGEHRVMSVRTHWKSLIAPVVLLLAVTALASFCAALVPAGQYRYPARLGIAALALILLARLTLWPFLVWATTSYTLTDRRLASRSGVLRRVGRDIPLHRVSDVAYERSLSDRVFGCGTLVVATANEGGETLIDDIPHVGEFHLAITSLLFEQEGGDRYSGRRDEVGPPPRDNHLRRGGAPVRPHPDDGRDGYGGTGYDEAGHDGAGYDEADDGADDEADDAVPDTRRAPRSRRHRDEPTRVDLTARDDLTARGDLNGRDDRVARDDERPAAGRPARRSRRR